jgi:protein gp37
MGKTSIQWTDFSWNPIRARDRQGHWGHYCEKISSGCANCYASRMQKRFGMPEFPGQKPTGLMPDVYLDEKRLKEPLSWRTPRKVFVCDMSDLFGPWVPSDWLNRIFSVMEQCTRHTFQVLTKRTKAMADYLSWRWGEGRIPSRNIWVGTSVENQQRADERIPHLLRCPAAVRFLSAEPLLGPIDLSAYLGELHWVIVGGES